MKRFLLGVAIAALLAPNAYGQAHNFNVSDCVPSGEHCDDYASSEIVTIGKRIGQSYKSELTNPASILEEEEIAARGQQHVSDLLRSLPGVAVNSSGPAGGLTQIRVRGAEANHVLVLIDGVEVANPSSGEFDFSGLRAEDILSLIHI